MGLSRGQHLALPSEDRYLNSIMCPICGYVDKKSRINKEMFKCGRCGFTFNAQYAACLNLFSCSDESKVTVRGA